MKEQIEKLLHATPFQPFAVDVAEDVAYSIATPDHIWIAGKVLIIEDDQGAVDLIPYQHIRRVRYQAVAA